MRRVRPQENGETGRQNAKGTEAKGKKGKGGLKDFLGIPPEPVNLTRTDEKGSIYTVDRRTKKEVLSAVKKEGGRLSPVTPPKTPQEETTSGTMTTTAR